MMLPSEILPTAWYLLLGAFFAGYLALAGYNYGVGLLLTRVPAEPTGPVLHRRNLLNAVGPFFLGNEVWLIATAGILLGAFPLLEGELLAGLYPAFGIALLGVLLVTVGVPLRSRPAGPRGRAGWDKAIITGSALAAFGWGTVLANLLQGLPARPQTGTGQPGTADPISFGGVLDSGFVLASGLVLLALVVVHGANFLARRLAGTAADDYARLARRLIPVALAAVALATVLGALSDRVRASAQQPIFAVLLPIVLIVALLVAHATLGRGWTGPAYASTTLTLALPVLLIGAATWPYPLGGGLAAGGPTVAEAAASNPTLTLLTWMIVPLLPVLLGVQLICRWLFPARVDPAPEGYW